jgi:hypothetical protein
MVVPQDISEKREKILHIASTHELKRSGYLGQLHVAKVDPTVTLIF